MFLLFLKRCKIVRIYIIINIVIIIIVAVYSRNIYTDR